MTVSDITILAVAIILTIVAVGSLAHYIWLEREYKKWSDRDDE